MAQFKTAHDQRMVPMDVAVAGTDASPAARATLLYVGDLVTLTPAGVDASSRATPAYIMKAASLAAATHMIALSDQTISGNYINTDVKNYTVSNLVGKTRAAVVAVSAPILYTDVTKKVGLYPLFDKDDIIVEGAGIDLASA